MIKDSIKEGLDKEGSIRDMIKGSEGKEIMGNMDKDLIKALEIKDLEIRDIKNKVLIHMEVVKEDLADKEDSEVTKDLEVMKEDLIKTSIKDLVRTL